MLEPGLHEPSARHAAILGIDRYRHGLAALRTATADARAVARRLRDDHGYLAALELLDEDATGDAILDLLESTLPAEVRPDSALVLYFAGHGIALDDEEGPRGFLIPQDARAGEPETWLAMDRVRRALAQLPCRHLLVILDCCFAGSFRWASTRKTVLPALRPLYDSQYARYLEGTAWQVLTSASHGEEAQDVVPGRRNRRDTEDGEEHSPFAGALLAGLAGASDSSRGEYEPDGVITATELYQYVFEVLAPAGESRRQTPGLWPLRADNTGEFIFLSPRRERRTRPDPPLDDAHNPWRGLGSYGPGDAATFFGRERVVAELEAELFEKDSPLITVAGASGTGKSSVVKAGLLPRLRRAETEASSRGDAWQVVVCGRLGSHPSRELRRAIERLDGTGSADEPGSGLAGPHRLLFIDQFEELFVQCPDEGERRRFLVALSELLAAAAARRLRVLITLRTDFEAGLRETALGPWLERGVLRIGGLSPSELRDVIEGPARVRALYFEPPELVDRLENEVAAMPGGLPLLSFTLSEMYRRSVLRRRRTGELDRALTRADYEETGGVVGSIHRRASELLQDADAKGGRGTVRRMALRMVSSEGGKVARRRITLAEIEYPGPAEKERVRRVKDRLIEARLLVAEEEYLEPAHDTLVQAWPQLNTWLSAATDSQPLLRAVWRAACAWNERGGDPGLLWSEDPRLPQVRALPRELNELETRFVRASVRRKSRRRRWLAASLAAVALALAGLSSFALLKAGAEASARHLAEARQELAETARQEAEEARRRAEDVARVAVAGEWLSRRPERAVLTLLEVARPVETPYALQRMVDALGAERASFLLRHDAPVRRVTLDAAGSWIATITGDGLARLWPAAAPSSERPGIRAWGPPRLLDHEGVTSIAFRHDGTLLATASEDGSARVWPLDPAEQVGPEPLHLEGHGAGILDVAFSVDGRRVLTASRDGTARVWYLDRPGTATILGGHPGEVTSAAFGPEGSRVVTAASDGQVRVWDLRQPEGGAPRLLRGHRAAVVSVVFDAGGTRALSASRDGTSRMWELGHPLEGGSPEVTLDPSVIFADHAGELASAVFHPDGRRALSLSSGGAAQLWSTEGAVRRMPSGRESRTSAVFSGHPLCAALSPDGNRVATGHPDGSARVWDVDGEREPLVLRGHSEAVVAVAFDSRTQHVLTASRDGGARVWTLGEAALREALQATTSACLDPEFRKKVLWEPPERAWAGYVACELDRDRCPALWQYEPVTGGATPLLRNRLSEAAWRQYEICRSTRSLS